MPKYKYYTENEAIKVAEEASAILYPLGALIPKISFNLDLSSPLVAILFARKNLARALYRSEEEELAFSQSL